jgi:macrolide transport system ATP-binding/permease protein
MAAADKQASGADPETARWLARREFGNVALVNDVTWDLSGCSWLERLGQDLHFATRQICRNPGFFVSVILTLALGISVNTTIFGMVKGFM